MSGPTNEALKFLVQECPALSSRTREFVRRRPGEARLAVAVALETAAAQYAVEDSVPGKLRPFIVDRNRGKDILGVSEAAARLEVSRTTVYDWVARGTLLAWKSTKRGLSIPAAQVLGPGRVVPGLANVMEVIGDPELAWIFLTRDWPFEETVAQPLELLKAGRMEEVLGAAPGFGASFT